MTRKITAILAALALLLSLCSAFAETTPDLVSVYDEAVTLFTGTENVTLSGNAQFSMDGKVFKSVDARYRQDGTRSYQDLKLYTPREDKDPIFSGYTIMVSNDEVYWTEYYNNDMVHSTYCNPSSVIFEPTVALDPLLKLSREVLAAKESGLNVTPAENLAEGSTGVTLHLNGENASINSLLNMGAQYLIHHFFFLNQDSIKGNAYVAPEYFGTVAEGIRYSMKELSFRNADITLTLNQENRFDTMACDATLNLRSLDGADHEVKLVFSFSAFDYGTTSISYQEITDFRGGEIRQPAAVWAMDEAEAALVQALPERARQVLVEAGYTFDLGNAELLRIECERPYYAVNFYGVE